MKRPLSSERRNGDTQSLKDTLQDLIRAYRLQGKLNQTHIVASWEKIMGRAVALKTSELYFQNGKLFVRISSAPLRHQLYMGRTDVVRMINEEIGEQLITEVVFL